MLWLYDNKFKTNELYDFYQIFIEYDLVYNDEKQNNIYSFNLKNSSKLKFNLNDYKYDDIKCKIKIIDHIISYDVITKDSNKQYVFSSKMNFIEPNDNRYKIPIFKHVYKSINTKRLPNLIETEYNFSSNLEFKIYKLDKNNNILFIIETNPITNLTRNYYITTDLNLVQPFIYEIH